MYHVSELSFYRGENRHCNHSGCGHTAEDSYFSYLGENQAQQLDDRSARKGC